MFVNTYLCLRRDIPDGGYKTFDLSGHQLIAKKENTIITVAYNRCRHRQFRVAEGCSIGEIKCPYHGLKFNFEDKLHVTVKNQAVFISSEKMENDRFFPMMNLGEEFGSYRTMVKAPFHLWIQNTADPNHLATIHPSTFNDIFLHHSPYNVEIHDSGDSSYLMPIKEIIKDKYRKYAVEDFWFDKDFYHMIYYPHVSITSFLGIFFSIETAMQIDDDYTEVYTRFFVSHESKVPELLKKLAFENNKKILQEDGSLIEHWAKSYEYSKQTKWLPGEERVKAYADKIERLFK